MPGERNAASPPDAIEMPVPTSWPLMAAFGVTFVLGGLVTHPVVSMVGAVLFVASAVGWFREVLPREHFEEIPVRPPEERARPVVAVPQKVQHLRVGTEQHRMRIPIEIHPYSAGVRGGLVGAVVMAVLAVGFGLLSAQSPWYPINLLAAAALPSLATASHEQLLSFDAAGLAVASIIHVVASLIVGLLYGLILPMLPRHPLLLGGLIAPVLWSGLLWAALGVINPVLNARIEWPFFVASQIGFGLAAGWVVSRSEKIATLQSLPFVARAGIEAQDFDEEPKR